MADSLFDLDEFGPPIDIAAVPAPPPKPRKVKNGCRVAVPPIVQHYWRWFPAQRRWGVAACLRQLRQVQERASLSDEALQERITAWARHKPEMAPWELAEPPPRPPVDVELPRSPAPVALEERTLTETERRQSRAHASLFQSVPFEDV